MTDWQPIETAPKGGVPVILCCRGKGPLSPRRFEFGRHGIGGKWYRQDNDIVPYTPTHWMPLPAPPEQAT